MHFNSHWEERNSVWKLSRLCQDDKEKQNVTRRERERERESRHRPWIINFPLLCCGFPMCLFAGCVLSTLHLGFNCCLYIVTFGCQLTLFLFLSGAHCTNSVFIWVSSSQSELIIDLCIREKNCQIPSD